MPAGSLNLEIEQGATFRKQLTWTDESGNPVDLTGYSAKMRIAVTNQPPVDLSTDNGWLLLKSGGVIEIFLPASETDSFKFSVGKYDLKLIASNGGDEVRLVEGSVHVSPSITPR